MASWRGSLVLLLTTRFGGHAAPTPIPQEILHAESLPDSGALTSVAMVEAKSHTVEAAGCNVRDGASNSRLRFQRCVGSPPQHLAASAYVLSEIDLW